MNLTVFSYNCKVSPQKAQLVAKEIRGKNIDNAIDILTLMKNKAAALYLKLLKSAVANVENNYKLDYNDFLVCGAMVDKGRVLKRVMPRAKGRADRITKRYAHLQIILKRKKGS